MNKEEQGIQFRKNALEQISKPALIDDVLQVISAKNWLMLIALFLAIMIFLAWLIWGRLYIRVPGEGILLSSSQNPVVIESSVDDSSIKTIHVKVGDRIKKNTLLITMDNEYSLQQALNKIYLDKLLNERTKLVKDNYNIITQLEKSSIQQIAKIKASLSAAEEKVKQLEIMRNLKKGAFKKGIIDLPNLTETHIDYYTLLQEIRAHEAQLIMMNANLIDLKDKWRIREQDLTLAVYQREFDYDLLKMRWALSQHIDSPIDGVVAEISASEGDYTHAGELLITIIPDDNALYALAFVPASKGKLIRPGMQTQISPTIFNKIEYGAIQGEVMNISMLPVTPQRMLALVKNQNLVDSFLKQSPLMAVGISLNKNDKTASGYQWTSDKGPNAHLTQGTLVNVLIEVQEKRPINLLLHILN